MEGVDRGRENQWELGLVAKTKSPNIETENEKEGCTTCIHRHATHSMLRETRERLRLLVAFAYATPRRLKTESRVENGDVEIEPEVEATCRTCREEALLRRIVSDPANARLGAGFKETSDQRRLEKQHEAFLPPSQALVPYWTLHSVVYRGRAHMHIQPAEGTGWLVVVSPFQVSPFLPPPPPDPSETQAPSATPLPVTLFFCGLPFPSISSLFTFYQQYRNRLQPELSL